MLMADVSEGWVRGRPRLGLMDGLKMAVGGRGMTVDVALMRMQMIGFNK